MDNSAIATLLVGFLLGLRHATDTDHLVAVSTLLSDGGSARRGALVGAFWGLGHLLTVFVAGSVLILLRVQVPPKVEWGLELLVAVVLIWLGVHTIRKCFAGRYHFHVHQHGSLAHAHLHFHRGSEEGHEHAAPGLNFVRKGAGWGVKPLLIGMMHGLAGTAGLTLLVLASVASRVLGLLYLMVFGLGALLGMVAFSAVLSMPLARAAGQLSWLQAMRLAAGAGSATLGAVLAYQAFLPPSYPF